MNKENNYIQLHSQALQQAIIKRLEYFEALPEEKRKEAFKFQEFIDNQLKKAGSQNNRLLIIQNLLKDHLNELLIQSSSLSKKMIEFSSEINAFSKEKSKN